MREFTIRIQALVLEMVSADRRVELAGLMREHAAVLASGREKLSA